MGDNAQGTLAGGGMFLLGTGSTILASGTQPVAVGLGLAIMGLGAIVFRAVLRFLGGELPGEVEEHPPG